LLTLLTNRRIFTVALLGFASGLPLALGAGTLQAWLASSAIDIRTIGIFALTGLPYLLKPLWAPLLDRYALPRLGRRRGWLLGTQLAIVVILIAMAGCSPQTSLRLLGVLALTLAFCSASQDIVFDAYRTELLTLTERGPGAATSVLFYRLAMLVSGALALILADRIGWRPTYLLMAGLMALIMLVTLTAPEPPAAGQPRSLAEAVIAPLAEFLGRPQALLLLLLIVLYKLGDAAAGSLSSAFLISGVGFTPGEVGAINKGLGLMATLAGALLGGGLLARLRLYRALWLFGLLQALTNLLFMALALAGHSYVMLLLAVAGENLAGGMGTVAFVALLMALCDRRYTAAQYALLSALAALGRVLLGPIAGYVVVLWGWPNFFLLTFVIALPGLGVLWYLRQPVAAAEMRAAATAEPKSQAQ
jgi:PAT family beta-lactamase induction signal transducer AmpG